MKILFCNYEYPPLGGGGGVFNALLAQELAKRHEVTVLTSQGLDLPQEQVEQGVQVVRVPVLFRRKESVANLVSMLAFLPMGIWKGKKLVTSKHFDVMNTQFVLPTGPVGDALGRYANLPNVLTVLGGDLYDPSKFTSPHRHPLLRIWVRHLLKRADKIVGESGNILEIMHRFYLDGLDEVRIPLGIPQPHLSPVSRDILGIAEKEIVLVTVGRLVARKGIHQLIRMMVHFRDKPVRLLILGSGPQERTLRQEAIQGKVDGQVMFMGHVEETDKFNYLQLSDFYVSTSQHEGFGIVFLEAMACGLPVICYNHGGQTDFLCDEETGYLVPLNDHELFLKRCRILVENRDLRKMMGDHNRKKVEEYYIEHCARQYEQVFQEVIERHKRGKGRTEGKIRLVEDGGYWRHQLGIYWGGVFDLCFGE